MDSDSWKQFSLEASDRLCPVRFLLRETVLIDPAFGMGTDLSIKYRGKSCGCVYIRRLQGRR